jgi:hypothetical protein
VNYLNMPLVRNWEGCDRDLRPRGIRVCSTDVLTVSVFWQAVLGGPSYMIVVSMRGG